MRLYRVDTASGPRHAVERDGVLIALGGSPVDSPEHEQAARDVLAGRGDGPELGPASEARLLAPWRPGKVVAIGLNYADHIRETGMEAPVKPLIFAKFTTSVVGPADDVVIDPELTERVDWEVELGVVVGDTMRNVPVERALGHVLGYTVANDVSGRDVQLSEGQWIRGKSFDTFCPIGPAVVTADEVPDPQALRLWTRVNGETVQDSTTAEMIFGVAELLAYCSRSFTLERGDLLLTGTPWGCGEFQTPKRSLAAGDVMETEVEGLGVLRNAVVAAGDRASEPVG
jgi:2-keto-4-pentenoate hydratase/2-oxohepta-3-ene-1,7-dioic acid hydratase in catechol pathway